ncbi:MAG: head-tail joining protein [Limnohabitans sp.]
MFDLVGFFATFEAHGLATRAFRAQVPGDMGFIVGFVQPDEMLFGEQVQTALFAIEYTTADAPALALGTSLTIDGKQYRVNQQPRKQGDGTFSRAALEEQRA